MCGIAGIIGQSDAAVASAMLKTIAHRGPDDSGVECFESGDLHKRAALGHVRLSIIDLSPDGRQPMSNEDGRLWITFNGEIYNYAGLRDELIALGHVFRSHSDTETILHGYEQWGLDVVARLIGMFAFGLFDTRTGEFTLVRDRFGIKPVYYTRVGEQLAFASEIKALLEVPGVRREIDPQSLDLYLTLGYVPGPRTMFRGIEKLQPGTILGLRDGRIQLTSYWSPPMPQPTNESFDDQAAQLGEILDKSVADHLVADVPVASFLSGGLDSSIVTALMALHMPAGKRPQTYCVGYDAGENRHDERSYARIVADHVGTDHREIICDDDYAAASISRLIWHMDEPIAEDLLPPYARVCELARRDVKVTLSGEGADEFIYGYRYYGLERVRGIASWAPSPLRSLGGMFVGADEDNLKRRAMHCCLASTELESFLRWANCMTGAARGALYGDAMRKDLSGFDADSTLGGLFGSVKARGTDFAPAVDARYRMVDYILARADKLSMAVSLEVRVPFLDHRVAELLARVPVKHKIKGFSGKQLLRAVARPLLPAEIVDRRKKPFGAPVDHWLDGLVKANLTNSRLVEDGVLSRTGVDAIVAKAGGGSPAHMRLWMLLVLEMWYRIYIRREVRPSAGGTKRELVTA